MKGPVEKPKVRLTGVNGNAFLVMGRARKALQRAGADKEYMEQYVKEATAGDYDNLIQVTMRYVEVS